MSPPTGESYILLALYTIYPYREWGINRIPCNINKPLPLIYEGQEGL